jgi:hypothetical protein
MGMPDLDPYVTVDEAAAWLGVSVEQMLAWNMVAFVTVGNATRVPRWSTNPQIARFMPTLSEVFQGEALAYCLTNMRPFGDDRTGVEALRSGHWQRVLDILRDYRNRFDELMAGYDAETPPHFVRTSAAAAPMMLH